MADEIEEGLEDEGLVPYAPDFTPATLGKTLGEDAVLAWLLERVASSASKAGLQTAIAETCLAHVPQAKDRRDMASHVVQALQNYELMLVDDDGTVRLTAEGERIRSANENARDEVFARHILSRCNGYRLAEAIQRYELRGQKPSLELLTEELDRSATSKNISTMKAWLARAGIMRPVREYEVDAGRLEEVLGNGASRLLGLERPELEFLLAARVLSLQQESPVLEGAEIRICAEMRAPGVRIPGKALGSFVRGLVEKGLFEDAGKGKSKGGNRVAVTLSMQGIRLTDDQVRSFVEQSSTGMLLSDLKKLDDVLADLHGEHAEEAGWLARHSSDRLAAPSTGRGGRSDRREDDGPELPTLACASEEHSLMPGH